MAPMLTDYTGAGSRLAPDRGLALDPDRWGWMPKVDGVYARITLDRRGRIATVLSRSGSHLSEARELLGLAAGAPDSVLHGELEAHTEAGNRAASRGWRLLHLFDVTRHAGRDVTEFGYLARYELLHQAHAAIEQRDSWHVDEHGDAHDLASGRYVVPAPRDSRRIPIVPLVRDARSLWDEHVERGGGEGLVAVRLDAPVRARGGKRKIKATDTIDCRVVAVGGGAARLEHGGQVFAVSARGRWSTLAVGEVVEVACDGWYEAGATPRFARIVRVRCDLAA